MGRSPRKSTKKVSGSRSSRISSSPSKTPSGNSPSKRSPLITSSDCLHSKIYSEKYCSLVNAGISIVPSTPFAQLEELAQQLTTEGTTVDFFQTPSSSQSGGTSLFNPFITASPQNINSPSSAQPPSTRAHRLNAAISECQAMRLLPLPPSSPLREAQSQPDSSSPMRQPREAQPQPNSSSPMRQPSSLASSTPFLSSSPTKPRRSQATQKDPLFGHVRGAAKGSQLWNIVRDKLIPAPQTKVSESTRRYRRKIKKIICRSTY
ncbi:hypothetical protein GYMLUDRAFT_63577 [Collybiopsis luxurians FD-317 M1]|uniref:Uncharacterized protein n=1 Tax=Collybiopsis luxurians FD-317 M1 TaxID=944289 RepID=A0A0D0C7A6_9AGAR|nr:hypothetical protein GYMLUDRAFT_63577 [Collybiopsis luxurians FD-317 M1]